MTVSEPVRAPGLLRRFLIGFTGLFYAYAVWNAVAYLVTMAPLGLTGFGWFLLLFAAAFPFLVYAGILQLTRRRSLPQFVLVSLAGLGLCAAFWMNVLSYATMNPLQMLG